MIDNLIRQLDRALHGPARVKRRLLEEAHTGLLDAADAYTSVGLNPADATRRAVSEFGTVAELAPAFQAELDVTRLRTTASALLLVLPVLASFADLAWDHNPHAMAGAPGWVRLIGMTLAAVTAATVLAAIVVLLRTRRATDVRTSAWAPRALRFAGRSGLATCAAGLLTLAATAPAFVSWPPFLVTVALVAATYFLIAFRHQDTSRPLPA